MHIASFETETRWVITIKAYLTKRELCFVLALNSSQSWLFGDKQQRCFDPSVQVNHGDYKNAIVPFVVNVKTFIVSMF